MKQLLLFALLSTASYQCTAMDTKAGLAAHARAAGSLEPAAKEDSPVLRRSSFEISQERDGKLLDLLLIRIRNYSDKMLTKEFVDLFFEKTSENSTQVMRFIDEIRETLIACAQKTKADSIDALEHSFAALLLLQRYEPNDGNAESIKAFVRRFERSLLLFVYNAKESSHSKTIWAGMRAAKILQYAYIGNEATKIYQFLQDCKFRLEQMDLDETDFRDPELAEFYAPKNPKSFRKSKWSAFWKSPRYSIPIGILVAVTAYWWLNQNAENKKQ